MVDFRTTKSIPAEFSKGDTITLELNGAAFKDVHIDAVKIKVRVAGVPFYQESHDQDVDLSFGYPFSYSLTWPIPAFAPNGIY
mmetsp:Transcript_15828/g.15254  ORF Transcript_15828/g.15254 Transcript_15828/m.15254 type:complete len:83 (+) Transcript_15828:266-514(+)|eukprot:CAMPEP_0170556710 /NCGR_PEP_ID=MMETSP0211-20121228/18270_1 /TAXON_ID=311385 /ORGANISM="Pseudokeronopsis sp., Strain OXSARD2" /LENGTH=82 /DNA_ID=CAMNT_0010867213 /DNA_START=253 /DNA_END=501 /DNA_ORIENTATION=+